MSTINNNNNTYNDNNNNITDTELHQLHQPSSCEENKPPPQKIIKKTHIRVNSDEVSTFAAEALNKLSPIPSSMTNRQHQANSFTRTVVAAFLIILCVLLATDILSNKNGNASDLNLNKLSEQSSEAEEAQHRKELASKAKNRNQQKSSSGSSEDNQNQNNNKNNNDEDQSMNTPKKSSSSTPSSPYFIDTSDYWSQPGKELFRGTADPKSISNGVYYDESSPYKKNFDRKQSDIFKCYYDFSSKREKQMNSDFDLLASVGGSNKNQQQQQQVSFTSQQELTNYYFQPPKVVSSASSSSSSVKFYQYDIVLFPVGCFGDAVLGGSQATATNVDDGSSSSNDTKNVESHCTTTSCKALNALVRFVPCAKKPVGLILGDNFYPSGLTRRTRSRLEFEFGAKFLTHKLFRFPWFGTVGNHDHPHASQQFRYHKDSLWVMPQAHHASPLIYNEQSSFSLQVFFVSTLWGYDRNWPHMANEAEWLDAALANSSADIKIVASHEPIYNFVGFEHSRPLIQHIDPILRKHGVPLWVSAHAHSVQLHRCPGGYYQLVSAGFADNLHQGVRNMRPRGHFYFGRGAAAVAVNSSHVVVTAMDLQGRNVFNFAFDWKVTMNEVKKTRKKKNSKNDYSDDDASSVVRTDYLIEGENRLKNMEVGIDKEDYQMWKWGKLCDRSDEKMNGWWCAGRR